MSAPINGEFDAQYLRGILKYDPETGLWLRIRGSAGRGRSIDVGYIEPNGRLRICIRGRRHYPNRLAWLYMTGEWPSLEVDHVDRDKANDKWANFRLATEDQQQANKVRDAQSKTGYVGIRKLKRNPRYLVIIQKDSRCVYRVRCNTLEEAIAARERAMTIIFGEFIPKQRQYTGKDLFK